MSLYLLIILLSVSVPLFLSFDKRVQFFRKWKGVFPSILIAGTIFILVDVIFTRTGIWGFNPRYLSGIYILDLPVEEWLFFICIPYSCLFIHYVYVHYSGNFSLQKNQARIISALVILILLIVIILNIEKTYTVFYSALTITLIAANYISSFNVLGTFYLSFMIILIPFFIVDAILTGTFIEEEIVWYNNREILGIRILTVPAEDVLYAFSMILLSLLFTEKFMKPAGKKERLSDDIKEG